MTTFNFLLNLLGKGPKETSKQGGQTRESIVSRFSLASLICACMLTLGVGNAWGTVLFHETFGSVSSNTTWNYNTHSNKSGVASVYANVEEYTVTNAKVSKNSMGYGTTKSSSNTDGSALFSNQGTTGVLIIGPLDVSSYESLNLTHWVGKASAGSWSSSSVMKLEYSTDNNSYTEVTQTGTLPSSAVSNTATNHNYTQVSYSLPNGAISNTLYLKFTFYDYQLNKNSVAIGQCYIDDIDLTGTASGGSSTYSVTYDGNDATSGSAPTDETAYSSGDQVTVLGNTGSLEKTNYTFNGWNTASDGSGTSYAAGDNFNITANTTLYAQWSYSGGGTAYTLLTDASDLYDGDQIVIVDESGTYALSSTQNDNNRAATSSGFSINETTLTVSSEDVQILQVGGSSGAWTLYTGSGYLYAASSSSNYLKTQTTNDANGQWAISVSSNIASIVAQGTNSRNVMQYNSNSSLFSCYSSASQDDLKIYHVETTDPLINPSASLSEFSYNYGSGPSDAQTFTVSGKNLTGNVTVTAPSNYQVSLDGSSWSDAGGSQTITASGTLSATTVYVRLVSGLAVGDAYDGNITLASDGATTKNVAVEGAVTLVCTTPTISFAEASVTKYMGGDNFTITPTITGNTLSAAVTYSSDKEACATVNASTGEVTIVNATGEDAYVRITATLASATDGSTTCTNEVSASYDIYIYNTVSWYVNGSAYSAGTPTPAVTEGGSITTMPTEPTTSDCDGSKIFVGWTTAAIVGTSADAPDPLYTSSQVQALNITDNMSFYAVFATSSSGAGESWTLTDLSNVTAGTYAIMTADYHAFNGSISDGHGQITDDAFSFTTGVASSAPEGTCELTFTASSDGFTIYNESTSKYLYASAAKSGSLAWQSSESSYWSYSSSNWTYAYNSAYLRSYGNSSLRTYGSNNGSLITLAKKTSATYSDYVTTCCDDAAVVTLTPVSDTIYRAANGTASTTITCSQTGGGSGSWGDASVSPSENATVTRDGTTITFSATATGTYRVSIGYTENCTKSGYVDIVVLNKINWLVSGNEYTEGSPTTGVLTGGVISAIPTDPDGDDVCGGKVFVGWTDAEYSDDDAPATLYTSVDDMSGITITATTNYYAVFAERNTGTSTYKLITDVSELNSASSVIVVYPTSNYAMNTSLGSTEVTPTQVGSDYFISSPASTIVWDLSGNTTDGFTLSTSGNYVGTSTLQTSGSGTLTTSSPTYYTWEIGESAYGGSYMVIKGDNVVLEYYSGWITYYVEEYSANQYCPVYLYVPGGLEDYSTTCGASIKAKEVERLTSYKDQTVVSQDIVVKGSSLSGSTLSASITGTNAGLFSCTLAETTITDEAINTTYTISYTPTAYGDATHTATLTFTDGTTTSNEITLYGRSLPEEFAIVAYDGSSYYVLDGSMSGNATRPTKLEVEVSDGAVVSCPTRAVYTLTDLDTPDQNVYLVGTGGRLWGSSSETTLNNKTGNATSQTAWLLSTDDFSTYHITNATTTSRGVMQYGDVFGHYAISNYTTTGYYGDLQLLPITAKCVCLDAPTVSVTAQSTSATITITAIDGAGSYEVTCDGGSVTVDGTTATITGLTSETSYDYTVKAVASEGTDCSLTTSGSFTTATCDDVPVLGTPETNILSATLSWTCTSATATVAVYSDADCTVAVTDSTGKESPLTINNLDAATTYYYKVLAGGTCASSVGSFTTDAAELEVVEWDPDAVTIEFGDGENALLTVANQQPATKVTSNVANDLFFSKYFEAKSQLKLIGIYNGTESEISLEGTRILFSKGNAWDEANETLDLSDLDSIPAFTEYILYSYTSSETGTNGPATCVTNDIGWDQANWYPTNAYAAAQRGIDCPFTKPVTLYISGDRSMALQRYNSSTGEYDFLDLFGAGDEESADNSACETKTDLVKVHLDEADKDTLVTRNDAGGWWCEGGKDYETDTTMILSTNRYLLIRDNTVVDGQNAIASNITDFATLCTEWKGKACGKFSDGELDAQTTCSHFQYVGTYDYNEYYVKYDTITSGSTFTQYDNGDGTYTIPVPELDTMSCTNLFIEITDKDGNVLVKKQYKVPVMVPTGDSLTTSALFNTYVRTPEVCKTCDVVILKDAVLTKATDGSTNDADTIRNLKIYEGGKLVVPEGTNYTVTSLSLRRKEDSVSMVDVQGTLNIVNTSAVGLDMRVDPSNWHYFTLPYDCNTNDITFVNGDEAVLNTDYLISWYDGAYRAANKTGGWTDVEAGTTLKKGLGYIFAIPGSGKVKKEFHFPMSNDVIEAEKADKDVQYFYAYGGDKTDDELTPNHKGWNLIGNPYMMYYATDVTEPLAMGTLTQTADGTTYTRTGNTRYLVRPIDNGWSGYEQISVATHMPPFTAYFVQIGGENNATGGDDPSTAYTITFNQSSSGQSSVPVRRTKSETEDMYPVWLGVELGNTAGKKDVTTLLISDEFTDEYDIMNDLVKMRGSYYKYYPYPVLASRNTKEELAFNALPDSSAAVVGVPLNYYAAAAGTYTFSLDSRYDLEEVTDAQLYDATTGEYYNLLTGNYSFATEKGDNKLRFRLFVSVERKKTPAVATDIDNLLTDGRLSLIAVDKTLVLSGLNENADIYVYDISGKLITGEHASGGIWRTNVPATGVYFVRVNSTAGEQTLRTIVK